ncbi:LamG domain-containing protein [Gilvibacter sp.]|uniref:LamG domain-containing protein n=1 Tax=Gilvibacter sp. TaxID=2729997 RepID=UPI003F4A02B7
MEKTTSTNRGIAYAMLIFCMIFTPLVTAQTVIHQATFESGLDGWTLVTNADRQNNVTFAAQGNYAIRIRNASGEMRSPQLALNTYDKIDVSFRFTNYGYDTGETFDLEYRPDTSSSWTIVGSFVAGSVTGKTADFQNGVPYVDYAKTVTIFKTDHTFPSSATGQFRFSSNSTWDGDRVYIDYVTVTGTAYNTSITEGPGGINNNLELWLRTDRVDGSGSIADNTALTTWEDYGKGNDANVLESYQAPTYYDNNNNNINFNPVLSFSNDNNLSGSDMGYLDSKNEMAGTGGFYSHDIYMVVTPDQTITNGMIPLDTFTSTDPTGTTFSEDVTGFGYGAYTQRFTGEYFAYCIGTTTGAGDGYGKGDLDNAIDLNQIAIINARHNSTSSPTGQNVYFNNIEIAESESDAGDFAEVSNTRYWLGRSQYWNGSFGGRIAEVITYSATNTDGSLTDNRNRIQSYLAIKYGITLGVNGVSQDYVDSNGNVIWDQSSDGGAFNWDIAGLGRSDAAGLMQKQSKSVNANTLVTMGMANIESTNNANTNDLTDDESYLVWGHDNTSLNAVAPIIVDMSDGVPGLTTIVEFTSVERTWKVVETGGDVQKVEVSVPEAQLAATLDPPGEYLMFISDTPTFNPNSEYRIMRLNGGNLETTYDFNGTKYITFGYAPENIYVRSVDFDGSVDYMDSDDFLDLDSDFTLSAWVKRDAGTDRDIISKRNTAPYTEGYAVKIDGSGHAQAIWTNSGGAVQSLTSSVEIPTDQWHHIAVTYDGTNARIYIDGVLDVTGPMDAPVSNSQHFLIAASDYENPSNFWDGGIDEVRVWDTTLGENQIRFIMNQEIIEHSDNTVTGSILPQSISLNEVSSIPWGQLMAYYPMTTYTFTNIKDESGNGNTAAIKNLDTVDFQTAPLPYETDADGAWDDANTWANSNVLYLPGSLSIVDNTTPIDWTISRVNHDLTTSNNTTVLGVFVNVGAEILVDNNNKFEVSHYLDLAGFIDLQGESQLVQTQGSDLEATSAGYIEIDQGGTADTYTYNYWSAPTSTFSSTSVNETFNINRVLRDGTDVNNPVYVNWVGGYNGAPTTPISLSDYWLFKYDNHPIGDYSSWQYLGQWGALDAGQGFTMKGPGSGAVTDIQNYTFTGKPNNDQTGYEIQLSITGGNNYLVGNPFASALDSHDFIADNPHLDGTLYFWEHWGGGSHILGEYQGGYAMYNLSGGVMATSHPDVSAAGVPTKTPGRYVAPSQGFFVAADTNGTIEFNNSQRNFVRSGSSSVFVFTDDSYAVPSTPATTTYSEPDDSDLDAPDMRPKLRIGFDSPKMLHRQLLLTIDPNTTLDYDRGYDGRLFDDLIEDLNWDIAGERYVIQGIPMVEGNSSVVLPLIAEIAESGEFTIGLDQAVNLNEKIIPYLRDKEFNIYTNLLEEVYTGTIDAGMHPDRFEIILRRTPRNRDIDTSMKSVESAVYAMHQKQAAQVSVIAKEADETISTVEVYSILGQFIGRYNYSGTNPQEAFSSAQMATGTYILKTTTNTGTHTVKILIEK